MRARSSSQIDTHFKPAWNSKNVPLEKIPDPMIGTIHGMLAADVHPNQNMEMGSSMPPSIATGRRFSGTKSVTHNEGQVGYITIT